MAALKINTKIYRPQQWKALDAVLKTRFLAVEELLRNALQGMQPTYAQLESFVFGKMKRTTVRPEIAKAVAPRSRHSYSMTQEMTCLDRALKDQLYTTDRTIYDVATQLRSLLFGSIEPPRSFDMTIAYHAWMRIKPPEKNDPLFTALLEHNGGPALFGALNIYLILLSAHPYSDGNGRTSRIMFNLHLAHAYGISQRYMPIGELTRATGGIYEEQIARASKNGNYRKLILHLLELFEAYARFLHDSRAPQSKSDLATVTRLAEIIKVEGSKGKSINDCPPYIVSIKNIVDDPWDDINRDFIKTIIEIGGILAAYGKIDFALTGLADLVRGVCPKTGAVAFFLTVDRKEELILHFRELRAKYRGVVRPQIAISTGDAVVDAKLLAHLASHYGNNNQVESNSCAVLLNDFHCVIHQLTKI